MAGKETDNNNPGDDATPNETPETPDTDAEGTVSWDGESEDDNVVPLNAEMKSYDELLEENAALKDRLLRAMADAENTRRRAQREKDDAAKYAISAFARDLLEVSDNLARALQAVLPEDLAAGGPHLTTLFEGVELTEKGLQAAFDRHQIQILSPAGDKFDPNFHQAVAEIPGTEHPHGTVVDVMQTGYLIGDRLLRPAMVTVAKGEPSSGTPGDAVDTSA